MSAANGFVLGFFTGLFFHYIFAIILIVAIGFAAEILGLGPSQRAAFELGGILIVLPIILSFMFKQKVFRRGHRSLLFIAYRNLMIVFGLAFIGIGYLQIQRPEMKRPLNEDELTVINNLPNGLRDFMLTLSVGQMHMIMGGLLCLTGVLMLLYGRSVEARYGQSIYDRDVAVVRDGINQSRL